MARGIRYTDEFKRDAVFQVSDRGVAQTITTGRRAGDFRIPKIDPNVRQDLIWGPDCSPWRCTGLTNMKNNTDDSAHRPAFT